MANIAPKERAFLFHQALHHDLTVNVRYETNQKIEEVRGKLTTIYSKDEQVELMVKESKERYQVQISKVIEVTFL